MAGSSSGLCSRRSTREPATAEHADYGACLAEIAVTTAMHAAACDCVVAASWRMRHPSNCLVTAAAGQGRLCCSSRVSPAALPGCAWLPAPPKPQPDTAAASPAAGPHRKAAKRTTVHSTARYIAQHGTTAHLQADRLTTTVDGVPVVKPGAAVAQNHMSSRTTPTAVALPALTKLVGVCDIVHVQCSHSTC